MSPCSCRGGLTRLNGLLAMKDSTEQDTVRRFKQDSGIAFLLMGELNQ